MKLNYIFHSRYNCKSWLKMWGIFNTNDPSWVSFSKSFQFVFCLNIVLFCFQSVFLFIYTYNIIKLCLSLSTISQSKAPRLSRTQNRDVVLKTKEWYKGSKFYDVLRRFFLVALYFLSHSIHIQFSHIIPPHICPFPQGYRISWHNVLYVG